MSESNQTTVNNKTVLWCCSNCGQLNGGHYPPIGSVGMTPVPKPTKMINKVTHVPLPHVYDDKLNAHMGVQNADGWELVNIFIEAIGIEERCIMIWGKRV